MILTEFSWRFATRRVLVTFGIRTVVAFVRLMCVALVTTLTVLDALGTPVLLVVERPPFRIDFDVNPISSTYVVDNILAIALVICFELMRSRFTLSWTVPLFTMSPQPTIQPTVISGQHLDRQFIHTYEFLRCNPTKSNVGSLATAVFHPDVNARRLTGGVMSSRAAGISEVSSIAPSPVALCSHARWRIQDF